MANQNPIFSKEARQHFVGRPFSLNYNEVKLLVSDDWKSKAGGIPLGCFLLAFHTDYQSDDNQTPQTALLLRALEPIDLPNNNDNVASMLEYYKESQSVDADQAEQASDADTEIEIDPYTRLEFSFSGIHCRVLGSFQADGDKALFSTDVDNFFAPNHYRVYKPTGSVLEEIVNQPDPEITNDESKFRIGYVRYSSANKPQAGSANSVPVSISAKNFLGKRTALFGMTRTGKSNTVKMIIEATADISQQAPDSDSVTDNDPPLTEYGLPNKPVGQIIFDVNGEYANVNQQDEGSAIYKLHKANAVRYSWNEKAGFKEMKINFYEEIQEGFNWIKKELYGENLSDYIKNFLSVDLEEPDDKADYREKRLYTMRLAAYKCCLYRARFPASKQMFRFKGHGKTDEKSDCDPKTSISLEQAIKWFHNYWEIKGEDISDEDLKYLLIFLTRIKKPGGTPSLTGYRLLSTEQLRAYHTARENEQSFDKQIDEYARSGKLIIVDLSQGDEATQSKFVEKICLTIFKASMSNFISNKLNSYIQFYFEEAHNLFPRKESSDLKGIYNRLAKEGAKLNLGLIYATQEVSSLSNNILKNTSNWFIAHLNNQDELKELKKYYDFEDFTDALIRFSANDQGFVRMKTYSNPFVVPVQVDKFTVVKQVASTSELNQTSQGNLIN